MKTFIKETKLNDGTAVKLYHTPSLTDCNATPLMLVTFADLISQGLSIGTTIGFNNESQVIWIEKDGMPIGGICFSYVRDRGFVWINFSFTDPAWRGRGVNGICHNGLEQFAKRDKFTEIASHVHVNNLSRIESCKKVGLMPTFYRMSKLI